MVASVAARCATGQRSWFNDLHPKWIEWLIPLGVGLACFTITEVMHYLLVPDIGRRKERWLAEAVSAFLLSVLVATVAAVVHRQYQVMLARAQVISEMNHHIRNALMAISASAYLSQNQECIRMISEVFIESTGRFGRSCLECNRSRRSRDPDSCSWSLDPRAHRERTTTLI